MMSTEREIRKRSKMSSGQDEEAGFVFHIRNLQINLNIDLH